jgi:hypothetical protein
LHPLCVRSARPVCAYPPTRMPTALRPSRTTSSGSRRRLTCQAPRAGMRYVFALPVATDKMRRSPGRALRTPSPRPDAHADLDSRNLYLLSHARGRLVATPDRHFPQPPRPDVLGHRPRGKHALGRPGRPGPGRERPAASGQAASVGGRSRAEGRLGGGQDVEGSGRARW